MTSCIHMWRRVACVVGTVLATSVGGCRDLSGTQALPAGTVNPNTVQTAAGAAQMAVAARAQFQVALATYIPISGVLTDELQAVTRGQTLNSNQLTGVDARGMDQNYDWSANGPHLATDGVYGSLQQARALAQQAIGALVAYAPTTSAYARGEMYTLEGYTEIMLADLFCSGVPLSTLDFQQDYTYKAGSTTSQVYQHAIALFDTALTLATDSAPIADFARVGEGRAYLALGNYAAAGQAVKDVPSSFQYADSIFTCDDDDESTCPDGFSDYGAVEAQFELPSTGSVSDREGGSGLPFISSGDPRTAANTNNSETADHDYAYPVYFPNKYLVSGISVIMVASGIEAQLITAEAQLNAGNAAGAFTTLNALRTGNALTAGYLSTLTDPGTFGAEVDTLFTERAAWLFVDGHRQGDLRRLVRQYENTQHVPVVANGYPTGAYPGLGSYGPFVDAPIPAVELNNPLFTGCLSRD